MCLGSLYISAYIAAFRSRMRQFYVLTASFIHAIFVVESSGIINPCPNYERHSNVSRESACIRNFDYRTFPRGEFLALNICHRSGTRAILGFVIFSQKFNLFARSDRVHLFALRKGGARQGKENSGPSVARPLTLRIRLTLTSRGALRRQNGAERREGWRCTPGIESALIRLDRISMGKVKSSTRP